MLKMKSGTTKKIETKVNTPVEPKVYFVQKTIGGDTYMVMAQSAVELEDEFSNLYYTTSSASNLFLMPPFDPNVLMNLVQTNAILSQCIEVMEVNIDGTGHTFVAAEEGKDIDKEEEKLVKAFFEEPYPHTSFVKIRRKLRRQLESIGYSFLEVLRSVNGDIIGFRNVETNHLRFVKLDAPILVKKIINRDGKDVEITMWDRERRFAQLVALTQQVYYREFGSTRKINRHSGEWETEGKKIKPEDEGSELLLFGIIPDITTPYFVPRWINNLPSVIGSRKAEEQNLQFLDSGGMPPAIIFVQGGTLAKEASDQLRMYLSGANKQKYRAVVIEAQSSSGSLDSAGTVSVKVERFGSQGEKDAMYMKYDVSTEEHVRVAFRLPPLFLGRTDAQNFATASVSYMVAEAQVFLSDRDAFDEVMNKTIIKELGLKTLKLRSNPITLKDIASMLKGLELSKDTATRESFLKEINQTTGTDMELAAMPQPDAVTENIASPLPGVPTVSQTPHEQLPASIKPPGVAPRVIPLPKPGLVPKAGAARPKKAIELIGLAFDYAAVKGLVSKRELTEDRKALVEEQVNELTVEDQEAFSKLFSQYVYNDNSDDLVSISDYAKKHVGAV